MVQRIGGNRRKTRNMLRKPRNERGKLQLRKYLQQFAKGDKVALKAEPSVQEGIYFRRFHGSTGTVQQQLGSCYEVAVRDGNRTKRLIVHPVHLRRVQ